MMKKILKNLKNGKEERREEGWKKDEKSNSFHFSIKFFVDKTSLLSFPFTFPLSHNFPCLSSLFNSLHNKQEKNMRK